MQFSSPKIPLISPLRPHNPKLHKTLAMVIQSGSGSSKRPVCPSCSKPTRTCLCTRFKTSKINNSVAITILQHTLEKNHPLNSTRIAALGLQNLQIISVSDVHFQANFSITGFKYPEKMGENCLVSDDLLEVEECDENGEQFLDETVSRSSEEASVDFTVEKYGVVSSFKHGLMEKGEARNSTFEMLMDCKDMVENLARGFVVKKSQRKQNGSLLDEESEESEEVEICIPEGSVLLFPSEKAVGVGNLECEVKNLIVLDGTWGKARRMYSENPWLRVLPHLRLDVDKMSLYSEVRQQPKAGYLSTIESIVYSLKVVGKDCEGLDGLLDVFESMVGDQRRFKDERLNEESA